MRRIPLLLSVFTLLGAARAAPSGTCDNGDERLDGRAIVGILPGSTLEAFLAAFQADHLDIPTSAPQSIPGRAIHLIEMEIPPDYTDEQLDQLEDDFEIGYPTFLAWGEVLYENEAPEGGSGSTFVDGPANLALYQAQYAVAQTGLDGAALRSTGAGIVVAVLDTGIDAAHPELATHIVAGGYDFADGDDDPADTGDGADNDGDGLTDEMVGHGTFVAGLIVLGAPDAKLLPVRVLDDEGRGDLWKLTQGMFHAIDRGVEVINISISSTYDSNAILAAIVEARNYGISVVAAAGNCNRNDPREYPAMREEHVIGVAAVDDADIKATFSNYHEKLIVSAPGAMFFNGPEPDPARSMIGPVPGSTPGGDFAHWEGTSMAAPLVSGALALARAQRPDWPADPTTHDLLRNRLMQTAVNIDAINAPYASELGAGRIDVDALTALEPPAPALGDLDADGDVDVNDLLALLADWGLVHTSADLDGSGSVAVDDLLLVLAAWGS